MNELLNNLNKIAIKDDIADALADGTASGALWNIKMFRYIGLTVI
jgi:hypothetical protein